MTVSKLVLAPQVSTVTVVPLPMNLYQMVLPLTGLVPQYGVVAKVARRVLVLVSAKGKAVTLVAVVQVQALAIEIASRLTDFEEFLDLRVVDVQVHSSRTTAQRAL